MPILACRVMPYRLRLGRKKESAVVDESEHGSGGGVAVSFMERLLAPEVMRISSGKSIGCGASLLCVARAK